MKLGLFIYASVVMPLLYFHFHWFVACMKFLLFFFCIIALSRLSSVAEVLCVKDWKSISYSWFSKKRFQIISASWHISLCWKIFLFYINCWDILLFRKHIKFCQCFLPSTKIILFLPFICLVSYAIFNDLYLFRHPWIMHTSSIWFKFTSFISDFCIYVHL